MLIATPTDTHSDLIERATAAGKAVMIGFNRRFDPNLAALNTGGPVTLASVLA